LAGGKDSGTVERGRESVKSVDLTPILRALLPSILDKAFKGEL
jgi:hypothetical protein